MLVRMLVMMLSIRRRNNLYLRLFILCTSYVVSLVEVVASLRIVKHHTPGGGGRSASPIKNGARVSQVLTTNDPMFVKTRHRPEPCPDLGYDTPPDSFDSLWIEISETGTRIATEQWTCGGCDHAADDGWYEINLETHVFRWFGIEENILTVGTNGVLTFGVSQFQYGSSEPAPCAGTDGCPGGGGGLGVDGALAVMWSDINVETVGQVYYQVNSGEVVVE